MDYGIWCPNCEKVTDYEKTKKMVDESKNNYEKITVLTCTNCREILRSGSGAFGLGHPTYIVHKYRKLCKGEEITDTNGGALIGKESTDSSNPVNRAREESKRRAKKMYKKYSDSLFGEYSPVDWYPKKQ